MASSARRVADIEARRAQAEQGVSYGAGSGREVVQQRRAAA